MRAIAICLVCFASAVAAEDDVTYLLKKTEQQASIPVWDLGYKPDAGMLFATMTAPLNIGEIGRIDMIEVVEVVDEQQMRADVTWTEIAKYKVVGPTGKEFHKFAKRTERNVWISVFPTNGLVDNKRYKPNLENSVFKVVGTKRYDSVTGARTVFHLEPFDVTPHLERFAAAVTARKAKLDEAAATEVHKEKEKREAEKELKRRQEEEKLTRIWTDSTGKFQLKAVYAGLKPGGVVVLRKPDGEKVEVKTTRLSRKDRDWIRKVGRKLIPLKD